MNDAPNHVFDIASCYPMTCDRGLLFTHIKMALSMTLFMLIMFNAYYLAHATVPNREVRSNAPSVSNFLDSVNITIT